MRPVVKSTKNNAHGIPQEYIPWGNAKKDLIEEIGSYCSYCEKKVNRSSIHVEHICGKKVKNQAGQLIYDNLKYQWNNFLLACCNCNSVKGNKDIASTNPFLPHLNNLVHFIEVRNTGLIAIKNGVTGNNLNRTKAFINLVGLDREPSHVDYSDGDDRWEERLEAVDLAKRYFDKYNSTPRKTDVETIIKLAREKGFFSVWYYQFLGTNNDIVEALINGLAMNGNTIIPFKGTHANSFQAPNFSTVERP